jgi:conjugal transfer/entry exclusion protein
MALQSRLFRGDKALEQAAVSNPAHITPDAVGDHVNKIQDALMMLDGAVIDDGEIDAAWYGPSTADAVLAYKKARAIINHSYQSQADNIVGIMTMARLDSDMAEREKAYISDRDRCDFSGRRMIIV